MIRILFICYGNICRSPMAEYLLRDLADKQGVGHLLSIASAATSTEEIWNGQGNPVYPPARQQLAKYGISCAGKRAVQVQKADYAKYDYLICMDNRNVRDLMRIIGSDPEKKVYQLLDFTGSSAEIEDPWFSGRFDAVFRSIKEGCEALLLALQEKM